LFRNGQVIVMDGGTTTLQVATHFPPDLHATVVTNSPPIAVALAEHPGVDVEVIGGRMYKDSLVAVGAATVEALRAIRADLCLLGVCSLHPEIGISVPDLEEVYVKRAMIANSAEVVALAAAEKLGTATSFVIAPIHELTHLVTERSVPADVLAPYRAHNITIIQG
jgi:DeoR/GlpR family transcriptional regulator of sugar metabolism